MAALRFVFVTLALLGFFLVGVPLQWLITLVRPSSAQRVTRLLCRTLLRVSRVTLEVEGCWVKGDAVMIVPNHISWIDILAFASLAPFCFLAKSEVARWPLVSAFASLQNTIFLDRRRRRSILAANRGLAARMREDRAVLLFPEGTTFVGPQPERFHSSHFAAARDLLALDPSRRAVAVQPVAIAYSRADAAWVGNEALVPHVWRVLRQPPLTCRIRFGAPILYRPGSDRKVVAREARNAVAALLARGAPARASGVAADVLDDVPATVQA